MKDYIVILVYVDDYIALSTVLRKICHYRIDQINAATRLYTLTDEEGDISPYLGIKVNTKKYGIHLTQPALIQRIIETIPMINCRLNLLL
jgi:hypothetical protein